MKTFAIHILNEEDQGFVMDILEALKQKNIIHYQNLKSFGIEGEKISFEELNLKIDKAEKSKSFSFEEAKKMLGQ